MWKTLFIVFYHNNYFSSNNIQFYSLKYSERQKYGINSSKIKQNFLQKNL
jgi:hypothetical protein